MHQLAVQVSPRVKSQTQGGAVGRLEMKITAEQLELSQSILVSSLLKKVVAGVYSALHIQHGSQKASPSMTVPGHQKCSDILELSSDDYPVLYPPSVFQFFLRKI